jgi:hypothetical protein
MAADPALDYPRPDVEALVWDTVRSLGGCTTWAYSSGDQTRAPAGWLSIVSVQVDVRARSKHAAFQRADQARRLILALPYSAWDDGVVADVVNLDGPFWLPDTDGCPRYVARYEVRVHPLPAASPAEREAVPA